jgi:hypothetical protein
VSAATAAEEYEYLLLEASVEAAMFNEAQTCFVDCALIRWSEKEKCNFTKQLK